LRELDRVKYKPSDEEKFLRLLGSLTKANRLYAVYPKLDADTYTHLEERIKALIKVEELTVSNSRELASAAFGKPKKIDFQSKSRSHEKKTGPCYRCGKTGHLIAECNVPADVKCKGCHAVGHTLGACRSKQPQGKFKSPEGAGGFKKVFRKKKYQARQAEQIAAQVLDEGPTWDTWSDWRDCHTHRANLAFEEQYFVELESGPLLEYPDEEHGASGGELAMGCRYPEDFEDFSGGEEYDDFEDLSGGEDFEDFEDFEEFSGGEMDHPGGGVADALKNLSEGEIATVLRILSGGEKSRVGESPEVYKELSGGETVVGNEEDWSYERVSREDRRFSPVHGGIGLTQPGESWDRYEEVIALMTTGEDVVGEPEQTETGIEEVTLLRLRVKDSLWEPKWMS